MNGVDINEFLAIVHWPAVDRALSLMNRIRLADLTTPEVLALVAIFEAADRRVSRGWAPVLHLAHHDDEAQR